MPRGRGNVRGRSSTRAQNKREQCQVSRNQDNVNVQNQNQDGASTNQNVNTLLSEDRELPAIQMFGESQHQNRLPAINVLPFSGKPDMLEYFISQLKELQNFFGWDDKFLLMMAKSKLIEKAQIYISQISVTKTIESAEELFTLLRNFFKAKPLAALIAEMESIRMLPAESIQNLTHRLDLAAARVYKDVPEEELNKLKFVKFISIIPPEIRVFVLQHTDKDYALAVEKAILAQECQMSSNILNTKMENSQISELNEKLNALTVSVKKIGEQKMSSEDKESPQTDRRPHYKRSFYQRWPRQNYKNNQDQYKFRSNNNLRGHGNINKHRYQNNFRNSSDNHHQNPKENEMTCQLCSNKGHSARFCGLYSFQSRYHGARADDMQSTATRGQQANYGNNYPNFQGGW